MIDAGIHSGDLLLIDKSIKPKSGDIVVAKVNSEFTLKRLIKKDNKILLQAENINFPAIEIDARSELEIFGVVVSAIKKF
jgi:DNA polymerase V